LGYRAQSSQVAHVGVSIADGVRQIEYELPVQLNPIAEEPLESYLAQLQGIWQTKLAEIATMIQATLDELDGEYVFKGDMSRTHFAFGLHRKGCEMKFSLRFSKQRSPKTAG
jgi:hypothetical protein